MAATTAMNIDSQRGGQWGDAVEEINNKVQQIMSEVAQKSGPVCTKGHRCYFDCGEDRGSICLILIWCGLKAKGAHYYGNKF